MMGENAMQEYGNWGGAWAAIPTPFDDEGRVDAAALRRHVEFLCLHHIDGIVACGTTGEAATMSASEKSSVIKVVIETVAHRVPVIAGVGTNDTRTTIENVRLAEDGGVDGVLAVVPFYNKPNQEGQYRHFMTVAEASHVPILLYDVPGRTGAHCQPATVGRLARHPRIVGIKDATGNMVNASQVRIAAGLDFLLFSGDDGTSLPFVSVGGVGAISVVANVAPELMHEIIHRARTGDYETARKLHERMLPLFSALFSDTSPIPLKAMLARSPLHYPENLRSPLFSMLPEDGDRLCEPFQDVIEAMR